jgi:hypothetical protein
MASQVEKDKCMLWFHEFRSVVIVQRRFRTVFGRDPSTKMLITGGINCSIRLAAFVEENAPGDDQSLKLKWIQFMWLSFAVHTNQPGMLPNN